MLKMSVGRNFEDFTFCFCFMTAVLNVVERTRTFLYTIWRQNTPTIPDSIIIVANIYLTKFIMIIAGCCPPLIDEVLFLFWEFEPT